MVTGDKSPSGSYVFDEICSTQRLVIGWSDNWEVFWGVRLRVSEDVFHFRPRMLTISFALAVPSFAACSLSDGLLEDQEQRLKFASFMINRASS